MTPKNLAMVLALTTPLALGVQPALAKGSHRGGGGSGHATSSGSQHRGSSTARSAPSRSGAAAPARSYSSRAGDAERRHPRAGTGTGYRFYRPGYGYHYSGGRYYRPYFYGSLYLGWPYYYGSWPYYGGSYYYPADDSYYSGYASPYAPAYGYADDEDGRMPARDTARVDDADRDAGRIRLEVRPDDASVYVDDEFAGTARETRLLTLRPGRHRIEVVRPGFQVELRTVALEPGETRDVLVELKRP